MKKYKAHIILILLYFLGLGMMIAIGMSSCSPPKRYKRLVEKHPELVERDTVEVHDTMIYERQVPVPEYRDSFIIKNDTVIETEKLIITKVKDQFHVVVKADTINLRDTITRTVKVAGKVYTKRVTNWYYILIAFAAGTTLYAVFTRKR